MTVESLTATLAANGIALYVEGDALRFRAPKGALTDELKQEIAAQRPKIIDRLRETVARGAESTASCRCDVNSWVDEPSPEGRIRTHCGKCGRFIGYRLENLTCDRNKALEPGRRS